MGKQVKCIDNDGFEHDLLIGTIYEVLESQMFGQQESYRMYNSSGFRSWYIAQRFEEIEEEEVTIPTLRVPVFSNQPASCDTIPPTEKPPAVSYIEPKKSSDNEDWKFFAKTQDGNCPCGGPRADCEYHK